MSPVPWEPPSKLSSSEREVAEGIQEAKLFRLLREIRNDLFDVQFQNELFDDHFQIELATIFKDSTVEKCPVPPAQLALAIILQAYTGVSDGELIEALSMDKRWQLTLDCLDCKQAPFDKGTLERFSAALIASKGDHRLVERTVKIALEKSGFSLADSSLEADLDKAKNLEDPKKRKEALRTIIKNLSDLELVVEQETDLPEQKQRMAIGVYLGLAVVSIICIGGFTIANFINNFGQQVDKSGVEQTPPPGPVSKPPVSPDPPKELESYWDLEKESNCSSGEVNVPSGYATLICEISDRDMRNVFVFSWNSVKQANKSNGVKDKIEHQVYFVPLNYRWELGSNSKIKHVAGEWRINLIADPLSYKDKARENFEHAMKGITDVFFIGMASREGNLQREEERARLRAKILHEAFYAFLPNPQYTNEYVLSFGKYDDDKCPDLINDSSEERPILIAMISGSGEYQQDVTYIYENQIQPDLEKVDAILEEMEKEIEEMNENSSSSGSNLVNPSCYSRGEKPEVIRMPRS